MDSSVQLAICFFAGMVAGASLALAGFYFGYKTAMKHAVADYRSLAAGSVTENRLADGAVTQYRLADRSVKPR